MDFDEAGIGEYSARVHASTLGPGMLVVTFWPEPFKSSDAIQIAKRVLPYHTQSTGRWCRDPPKVRWEEALGKCQSQSP